MQSDIGGLLKMAKKVVITADSKELGTIYLILTEEGARKLLSLLRSKLEESR